MAAETLVLLWYMLLILLPLHVAIFYGIMHQNKKRKHLLMAMWKMGSKNRYRR